MEFKGKEAMDLLAAGYRINRNIMEFKAQKNICDSPDRR